MLGRQKRNFSPSEKALACGAVKPYGDHACAEHLWHTWESDGLPWSARGAMAVQRRDGAATGWPRPKTKPSARSCWHSHKKQAVDDRSEAFHNEENCRQRKFLVRLSWSPSLEIRFWNKCPVVYFQLVGNHPCFGCHDKLRWKFEFCERCNSSPSETERVNFKHNR